MSTCKYPSINNCPFESVDNCSYDSCPGEGEEVAPSAPVNPNSDKDSLFVIESTENPNHYLLGNTLDGNTWTTKPEEAIQFGSLESADQFITVTFDEYTQIKFMSVEIVTRTDMKDNENG